MSFENFIYKQMKRAGINKNDAQKIFMMNKDLFVRAFTHKSAGEENYDMLEAFGDKILNTALFQILYERHPDLHQGTITMAFQKAKSEEILYREGEKEGFFEHIVMSKEYKKDAVNWRDNFHNDDFSPVFSKYNIYIKALEDTVESFCGALCMAVNKWSGCRMGPGAETVYLWAKPIVEGLPFDPTDEKQTKNIKHQLKEFWDTVYAEDVYNGNKIANHMMFRFDQRSRPGKCIVHVMDPDPSVKGKRKTIGTAMGYDQNNARLQGALATFEKIKKIYNRQYQNGLKFKEQKSS